MGFAPVERLAVRMSPPFPLALASMEGITGSRIVFRCAAVLSAAAAAAAPSSACFAAKRHRSKPCG
jgi:hypothetical protein